MLLLSATVALSYLVCLTDTVIIVAHAWNTNIFSHGSGIRFPQARSSFSSRGKNFLWQGNVVFAFSSLDRTLCRAIGAAAKKENEDDQDNADNLLRPVDASVASYKWKARFTPPSPLPKFKWKWLDDLNADPATDSFTCCELLMADAFIDKSAALYNLLKRFKISGKDDFRSVHLLLVYPRRFAKTTLMRFIEAVFSPVPKLGIFNMDDVKTKIAALDHGTELLDFGLRPVLVFDMLGISSVMALSDEIAINLQRAGLDKLAVEKLTASSFSPADLLYEGVTMLNEKFEADTGIKRKTIVIIDEYDKLFRDRDIDNYAESDKDSDNVKNKKRTIAALLDIFAFGKKKNTGISLLILCGLTRMVGSGLSSMNNLIDVSRLTIYHGLCGISARELVNCAKGQLDTEVKALYAHKTFKDVVEKEFAPKWNGFRFGIDNTAGILDPNAADGALFSPLDAWEIVQSLVTQRQTPSSRWIDSMASEFEFTSFAHKFTSTQDGFVELFQNLDGGWVDAVDLRLKLEREDYLMLKEELHVQKVLFELGLLSVKRIDDNMVLLGSPNDILTDNALKLLVQKANYRDPLETKAQEYMSEAGFGIIMSRAAVVLTNMYRGVWENAVDEKLFESIIYRELSYRFASKDSKNYELYKQESFEKTAAFL
jgi:hypothetical protein